MDLAEIQNSGKTTSFVFEHRNVRIFMFSLRKFKAVFSVFLRSISLILFRTKIHSNFQEVLVVFSRIPFQQIQIESFYAGFNSLYYIEAIIKEQYNNAYTIIISFFLL